MKEYDVVVIGAGSGGLVAALTAKRRGARVALLEKNKVGGECTHSGCVPSKTFISSARLYHGMKKAEVLGLPRPDTTGFDFAQVMEHVDDVVQGIYMNEQPVRFQDLDIDVYIHPSGAQFADSHEIRMGEDTIRADYTVISTGSSPRIIPHEGSEAIRFLTNENFWELREQPHSVMFLGGGVISVELGQSLARFGTHVTIIDRNPRILKVTDEEAGALATDILQREGVRICTNAQVVSCRPLDPKKIQINIVQKGVPKELFAEQIFMALGRTPNVMGLQLEQAGVEYSDRGVQTNEYLQTSAPNVYACGDVTSPAKFTHMASYQAEICVENILNGNHVVNDLSLVPWAIFMEPEIAHVGLTEADAREKYGSVNVSRVGTGSIDRFITESMTEGFLKVVMDENDVIVGVDAIGAHAGEWVQFFTIAIKHKLPIQSIADTIFVYPTFSEIVKKSITRYLRTKPMSNIGGEK
jgi:pyruvate/2-oxoglutarate dehydrogenase complex dihydrolipoamide dehydrogenase (E3) component